MTDFDLWHTADPDAPGEGGNLDPPADDSYDVALVDADAFITKAGDKTFVKTEFKVLGGQYDAYQWTVLHGFKSQGQANITKKTCREMGVNIDEVTSMDALAAAMKELIGTYYTVTVKTSDATDASGKPFRNTYVDGKPAGVQSDIPSEVPVPFTAPAATDDEDIPF